jgi:hypothetical protein
MTADCEAALERFPARRYAEMEHHVSLMFVCNFQCRFQRMPRRNSGFSASAPLRHVSEQV